MKMNKQMERGNKCLRGSFSIFITHLWIRDAYLVITQSP